MSERRSRGRRIFVPEVIQTSGMDCGVAAVKALVGGFGVDASYGRLREACQTDVDGTSINVMERLVNVLGVGARQVILPVDHVLLDRGRSIPAIAIVRLPNGYNHFVVVWRVFGRIVQIMDPARGRRWPLCDTFVRELYVHRAKVSRAQWHTWASTRDFLDPLEIRMRALGIRDPHRRIDTALGDCSGARIAQLDAAVRMSTQLRRAGAMPSRRDLSRLVERLIEEPPHPSKDGIGSIPAHHWFVAPATDDAVIASGAILVRVDSEPEPSPARPEERTGTPPRATLLADAEHRPGNQLWALAMAQWRLLLLPAAGLALLAVGTIVEALLLRGALDIQSILSLPQDRLAMFAAVPAFLFLLAVAEAVTAAGVLRIGSILEVQTRAQFMRKIPRVASRFLKSRLMSDMAERCQAIARLRVFPSTLAQVSRLALELLATGLAIAWLDPDGWVLLAIAVGVSLAVPFVVQRVLAEADLRVRNLNGSMMRFYLDSLRGLFAVRTHGAERALRREHEALLVEWAKAWGALQRTNLGVEAVQGFVGFGVATFLLAGYLDRWPQQAGVVLLLYWALNIPQLGQELSLLSRQYPAQRNVMLRLLEVLSAPEEYRDTPEPEATTPPRAGGVRIVLDRVGVIAGGHTLLHDVSLAIEPGMHVGVIGRSGAGKTTLLGLLQGWHTPATGTLSVDGEEMDDVRLRALRRQTAWVDPSVQLWNTTLFANLAYGTSGPLARMDRIVGDSDLQPVLSTLSAGFQSPLGDSGSLLSGGEGQRVRVARAMTRPDARLVLLDEPFRGLARDQRHAFLDRARRLWQGATLLLVTHDVAGTRALDHVIIVEGGRVIEQGPPGELAGRTESRYRQLLDADHTVRDTVWAAAAWTQLRIKNGRVDRPEEAPIA